MVDSPPKIETPKPKDVLFVVRVILLALLAIGAAAFALHRHYFVPRPSMLKAPVEREIPAPTLVPALEK